MNVFAHDSFQHALRDLIAEHRKANPPLRLTWLASAMKTQRTYLSNVLHGRAQLSQDQLFLLATAIRLPEAEKEYMEVLLDIERCSIEPRKRELTRRRDTLRNAQTRTDRHLSNPVVQPEGIEHVEYFSSPFCPLVHMMLTIPKYRLDVEKIQDALKITAGELKRVLSTLEKCGYVQAKDGRYKVVQERLHLNQDSHLSRIYATAFRLMAIEYQRRRDNAADYYFTASFSCTEKLRHELKSRLLDLIKWLSTNVESAKPEDIFHFNIDLFKV